MHKLALLSLVLLAACAGQSGAQTGAPAPASVQGQVQAGAAGQNDTLARIRAMIGTPSCSEDSQCHSLAIGQRACGGPESFLAYSTVRSSGAELRALGAIYQAERRKANAESGLASDCRFMLDPGAVCRAGACELNAAQPVAR